MPSLPTSDFTPSYHPYFWGSPNLIMRGKMGHLFEWATCYEQLTRTPLSEILYPPLQTSSSDAPVPRKRQCPWCPHTLPPCRHTKVVADSPISVLSVPDVLSNLFYSPTPTPTPIYPLPPVLVCQAPRDPSGSDVLLQVCRETT